MHSYRITIAAVGNTGEGAASAGGSETFEVENHDDLLKIVGYVRAKGLLDSEKSAALAVGLKLLSEIVLEKRHEPLFAPLLDPLHAFIKRLKAAPATMPAQDVSAAPQMTTDAFPPNDQVLRSDEPPMRPTVCSD